MRLVYPVPKVLRRQLRVNHPKLEEMSLNFNRVAAELKLFSFYETFDTALTPKANDSDVVVFTAPIVSIKSAVLEVHHEIERPLLGNHADCAAFGGANDYARWSYLEKLEKAVKKSLELCPKFDEDHIELRLKEQVEVEIHGFYEAGHKTASDRLGLWSTRYPLEGFVKKGPADCLNDFLEENTHSPKTGRLVEALAEQLEGAEENPHENIPADDKQPQIHKTVRNQLRTSDDLSRRPSAPGLTRPNADNLRLTWVHLPFNNPTWCSVSTRVIPLVILITNRRIRIYSSG